MKELQEQVRDLMFYLETQKKIAESPEGTRQVCTTHCHSPTLPSYLHVFELVHYSVVENPLTGELLHNMSQAGWLWQ